MQRFENFVRSNIKTGLEKGDAALLNRLKFIEMNVAKNKCPLSFRTTPTIYLIYSRSGDKKIHKKFDQGDLASILNDFAQSLEEIFGIRFATELKNIETPIESDL